MRDLSLAYVSQGKLFLLADGGAVRPIQSEFGLKVEQRALEIARKRAWKGGDEASPFGALLWGRQGSDAHERIAITAVAVDAPRDRIFYFLETSAICGLFRYDVVEGEELRLFHREQMRAADIAVHADGELLACSIHHPNRTASIATVAADGRDLQQLTEGDSMDEAPAWIPADTARALVFQSAGVARTIDGHVAGLSPASVQRMDIDSGEIATVAEDERFDLLAPRFDAVGNLFYIRRPYEPIGGSFSFRRSLTDVVLFPFRLARAVVAYLNVFSIVYSRKPLVSAGGPKQEGPDLQAMRLRGRYINVQEALRRAGGDAETASLVPSNWELVRRDAAGAETVLANRVAAFDLLGDGRLIFTNGRAIYELSIGGKPVLLAKGLTVDSFSAGILHGVVVPA
jgi:hypothetical protein